MKPDEKASRKPSAGGQRGHPGPDPRASIDHLLAEYLPGLTAFVRLRLGPVIRANESCADIVQSACREVLVHADRFRFDGDGNFRHWLFTTALRKITDRKRYYLAEKRRTAREGQPAEAMSASEDQIAECLQTAFTSPSQAAIKKEDVEGLERAFDDLPEADREVVVLARILGLSHAEIARRTGQTAGAVRARLSRALAKLAVRMRAPSRPNR